MQVEIQTLKSHLILRCFKLFLLLFLLPLAIKAQNCELKVTGLVIDLETKDGLSFANIYILEINRNFTADSSGLFALPPLCPGEYFITFSHVGCEGESYTFDISTDTSLSIFLDHSSHLLESVVVRDIKPEAVGNSIGLEEISSLGQKNISSALESITGVTSLKTGSGIAKPIIHGMYGNRLSIVNNEVTLSGQNWGNDHSPELDPFSANSIKVVTGVNTLKYTGTSLGSIILVEPGKIKFSPLENGQASYYYDTNGRAHAMNLQALKVSKNFAWRLNGTLKKSGDKKTPDHFLSNTGNEEANISLQIEKSLFNKIESELYISSFNTRLGILRGSHISNTTDLMDALEREIPFFTKTNFSYSLEAPRQKVNHNTAKIKFLYDFESPRNLSLVLAAQNNNRQEFHTRRSGRSDIPSLSLRLNSYDINARFESQDYSRSIYWNAGILFNLTDNVNNPETGIFPLIPDFRSFNLSSYILLKKRTANMGFETGLRIENIQQNIVNITQTVPIRIEGFKLNFLNPAATVSAAYSASDKFKASYILAYSKRSPAINELFSAGLHQGVSGIEEGNSALRSEQSLKNTITIGSSKRNRYSLEATIYYQRIANYIYLEPSGEFRLTIRGAFPVFAYTQQDAELYGLDFSSELYISKRLDLLASYSQIAGFETASDRPIINLLLIV